MIDEEHLTTNFTISQFTRTDRPEFQEKNRQVTEEQIKKLKELARLMEHIQYVLSVPIIVNSAYRCPELNKAVGSTDRSQHLLCEAVDFVPGKMDIGEAFRIIWRDIKDKGTNVGQLIFETANRPYGVTSWIHVSLGKPYRDEARCKQILRMENGIYTRLA